MRHLRIARSWTDFVQLSVNIFVQNVITQVVERHLLQGLQAMFGPLQAHCMKEETVLAIAAEDKATREARMALKAKKVAIEEARDICAGLGMRKELRMVSLGEL
jgi:hypothetical protein